MAKSNGSEILAAGVVLLRSRRGQVQVCILHRPNHRDWSLPKGKLEDEHIVACARRETIEETGEDVVLGAPLPTQRYRVEGRPKSVRYWVGWTKEGGPGFKSNREIDDLEWVTPDKAAKKLSYRRDVQIMRGAVSIGNTSPFILLRHAQAARRSTWRGSDDSRRPLAATGKRAAKTDINEILTAFGIQSLYSSDALRCVQTLQPYADTSKRIISLEPFFSEEGFNPSKKSSFLRLSQLLTRRDPTVLCTHRPVLPELVSDIRKITGLRTRKLLDPALSPGGFIVLHRVFEPRRGMRVVAIERHDP